ncbi:AT-hook motif nuclear-localized protein 10 [Sesamum angolense]|uniref:AT-hook motif nuclear-localized protein n=1 Tax=Sesamum angolense TaxID=2727404 RepID=A0AAE1W6U0_9LAMI|nr:AT-hook motif nuclear-localized protein 10 [Sesamum angolense]
MSGVPEAAAVMTSRDLFTVGPSVSTGPASSQSQLDQQMRVPYTADGAYRPVGSPQPYQSISGGGPVMKHGMNLNSGDQKRKRGRPRKYGPDGSMAMTMASAPQPISVGIPQTQSFSPSAAATQTESQRQWVDRRRPLPRRPGADLLVQATRKSKWKLLDVSSKIMAFSQNGPRAVCILSANGAVSNVTLRQAATSGGTATYEGRFDILSLSGSFMLSEVGGQKSRTGGLSTTLAGPDGRVFGGCVAGLLVAASPVQVIVGSFIADGRKEPKSANYMEPLSAPPKVNLGSATGASSSPSRGTFSESSGGPASPLNLSSGACNNHHPPGMFGMPWK